MSWLEGLKEGDSVIVSDGLTRLIGKVGRRTKSGQVLVKSGGHEQRFNRSGWATGKNDAYRRPFLEAWSQEKEDEILAAREHRRLSDQLGATKWRELPLETLRTVMEALRPAQREGAI